MFSTRPDRPPWPIASRRLFCCGGKATVAHKLFAVADYTGLPVDIEAGIGFGLTNATDDLTLKLIVSSDLN